ncbi:hypothetical protein N8793_01310 [Pseudomonadales bacterium]|jgi:hypothetical protein|nr:hypothetical protein [Pseudomonadales bacterium]
MTQAQDELTAEDYSEFYEISQKSTREALKDYNLDNIDRDNLILETKKNKKSIIYKLFYSYGVNKTLISTTRVSTVTKAASVKVTNLEKNN